MIRIRTSQGWVVSVAVGAVMWCGSMVARVGDAHAATAPPPQTTGAGEGASIWDGVYTEEQAKRGKGEYEYLCATCHIHDLTGDPINDTPALAGSDFIAEWRGRSVKRLLEAAQTTMPANNPSSLDAATYADIVSYILQANKFPSGTRVLNVEAEWLDDAIIEPAR